MSESDTTHASTSSVLCPAAQTNVKLTGDKHMVYEDIFEPIEVISLFKDGRIKPLRFKWNGRVYKINRLNGHWVSPQGYNKQYHFSLLSDTYDYFEILFDTATFEWQIARVCLEG